MKGYFRSLAKQSGVSIGSGKAPSRKKAAESPGSEPLVPLHSETVVLVDPAPTTVDAHSVVERTQNSAEQSPSLTRLTTKPIVTGQSDQWVTTPLASKSARESHSVKAVTHETKPVEAPPAKDDSASSTAPEKSKDDASPSVYRAEVLPPERWRKEAGVIRVRESEDSRELETARD